MAKAKSSGALKGPSVVVKPLGRLGGLDGIHLSLMALVMVMAALLLVISSNNGIRATNSTTTLAYNCTTAAANGTCTAPIHNASQVRLAVEQFIARYSYLNTSYSLLPYISDVNSMTVSYSPSSGSWYASVPTKAPGNNSTVYLSFIYNDRSASVMPFIQAVTPSLATQNYVKSYGVMQLTGKASCSVPYPEQVYWFIDPYSPGSISRLKDLTALESQFGNAMQAHLEILYTQYSAQVADAYGINNTEALGNYLFCASSQQNFTRFVSTVNSTYSDKYMSPSFLATLAKDSGLDANALGTCMGNATGVIARQSVLAQYYNVTSTPLVITDCQYQSIPQTEQYALCIANSTLCK